jgi:hypothetical protein
LIVDVERVVGGLDLINLKENQFDAVVSNLGLGFLVIYDFNIWKSSSLG